MRRRSYQIEAVSAPKYKYSFNDKTYDLNVSSSFDSKIGAYRAKEVPAVVEEKIKSNSNFTLEKLLGKSKLDNEGEKIHSKSIKHDLKLPILKRREPDNPESKNASTLIVPNSSYYTSRVAKAADLKENGYLAALARQHFQQTIEALRIGKTLKPAPPREIKLPKKNPKLKTIYLDLDETLIHCDEMSSNYTVKLDFPVEGGSTISVREAIYRQASECAPIARTSCANSRPSRRSSSSLPAAPPTPTSSSTTSTPTSASSRTASTGSTAASRRGSTPRTCGQ